MTSFATAIEPLPQRRLAAAALLFHATAAAGPWLAQSPPALATGLSLLALGGLWATLARIPGAHTPLRAVVLDPRACRVRLADGSWQPATLHRATRAYGPVVLLELSLAGRRRGWLLPRAALAGRDFRRLKALIRLAW
ncbi:MAG: hypothetical protein ACT4UQ_06750 [Gammaproteobacteria bacterium]